jgi:hypothetical protein
VAPGMALVRKQRSGGYSLLTVITKVSAKHGSVVELRGGGGRGVSPAFGKRQRSGFANQDYLAGQYIQNTSRSR